MLIAPHEGKGAPISQMLNSRCAYNRIVGSRVIVKCALFRKTTVKLCGSAMEAGDFSFTFESVIRGHHVYKSVWTPFIGETLSLTIEDGNAEDPYAVAVMKGTTIVGHTPREISRVFSFFIQHDGTISAKVSGHSPVNTHYKASRSISSDQNNYCKAR